jgi:hypothetical protein
VNVVKSAWAVYLILAVFAAVLISLGLSHEASGVGAAATGVLVTALIWLRMTAKSLQPIPVRETRRKRRR